MAGLSETIIGLTIVAVGASLPEFMASLVAALRGRSDVAFGNIVGSNIYNIFGILGATALIAPVRIPEDMAARDWIALLDPLSSSSCSAGLASASGVWKPCCCSYYTGAYAWLLVGR